MSNPAELYIKSQLDGYFYTFGEAGRIVEQVVPLDFIPVIRVGCTNIESLRQAAKARNLPWTAEQDGILMRMRNAGATWTHICKTIRRGKTAARTRYETLCLERGIEPRDHPQSKLSRLTDEEKRQIVTLRDEFDCSFVEIEERLGLAEYVARDYYRRVVMIRDRRVAA